MVRHLGVAVGAPELGEDTVHFVALAPRGLEALLRVRIRDPFERHDQDVGERQGLKLQDLGGDHMPGRQLESQDPVKLAVSLEVVELVQKTRGEELASE
jgi:hypothetical protein